MEQSKEARAVLPEQSASGGVTRDGETLATADEKALKLWNLRTGELLRTLVQESSIASVTFSAGGFAFAPDGKTFACSQVDDIQIWRMPTL